MQLSYATDDLAAFTQLDSDGDYYCKSLDIYDDGEIYRYDNMFIQPPIERSIEIRSSTEGSNKWFRITVDDNGTISATEIT